MGKLTCLPDCSAQLLRCSVRSDGKQDSSTLSMHLVRAWVILLAWLQVAGCLRLAAFNIRSFGATKASNATLMDAIAMVVQRYDIIVIQEVRDSDLSATRKLMVHVNRGSPAFRYRHIVSEPLGRSTYKERYLFLYREQVVSVVKSYTFDDGCEPCGNDTFIREPFVVMFSSTGVQDFVLVPQHTSPDAAAQEIDALYDVVRDISRRWSTNRVLLLGDFNMGCSYITRADRRRIRLLTDKAFYWLIPNEADTTVTNTSCPYDRIVASAGVLSDIVKGSAGVYDFMTDLRLSHSLALAVSDHFPVEVKMIRH